MPEESDPLQSLIADIIDAEGRGELVDRSALLRQHPEHAESLREFFANHDSMKAGSYAEDATIRKGEPMKRWCLAAIALAITAAFIFWLGLVLPKGQVDENGLPKSLQNSIGMKLNLIPAGTFTMGSPLTEQHRRSNETQHSVTLSQPYYLGTTEVTQGQWEAVMGTTPWKGKRNVKEGANYAATYVSWEDAMEFCKKLSAREGRPYRLPTEAEWEYACRAGTTTAFSFGDDEAKMSAYAWWGFGPWGNVDQIEGYAQKVGWKRANSFGLYDMHGNVFEWCMDRYAESPFASVTDPQGPAAGPYCVYRGGGWGTHTASNRSASRFFDSADSATESNLGFRVAVGPRHTNDFGIANNLSDSSSNRELDLPALPKSIQNNIGMKLNLIPAGTFMMSPTYQVTLTQPYYLGTTEVTQGQWEAVMGTTPWKGEWKAEEGANYAATNVSWEDAMEFCRKLSAKEGTTYRLPKETEWENACRAGTTTAYSFGDDATLLKDYGWFRENSEHAQEVGLKQANGFGLYDMHGNVAEWCLDPAGSSQVYRGGDWWSGAASCQSTSSDKHYSTVRLHSVGFRVAVGG